MYKFINVTQTQFQCFPQTCLLQWTSMSNLGGFLFKVFNVTCVLCCLLGVDSVGISLSVSLWRCMSSLWKSWQSSHLHSTTSGCTLSPISTSSLCKLKLVTHTTCTASTLAFILCPYSITLKTQLWLFQTAIWCVLLPSKSAFSKLSVLDISYYLPGNRIF